MRKWFYWVISGAFVVSFGTTLFIEKHDIFFWLSIASLGIAILSTSIELTHYYCKRRKSRTQNQKDGDIDGERND